MEVRMRVAFALAGLGGFNAHGAGFLQAARKWNVKPELVTATSGQILVVADWLANKPDLRASVILPERDRGPLAQLRMLLLGDPGVFQPAYPQALARLASWPNFNENPLNIVADRLLPAQQYVPVRSEADFKDAAAKLNASEIGVVFNSYDPKTGMGFLHGNDAARDKLPREKNIRNASAERAEQIPGRRDQRYVSGVSAEREIHPITAEAVKSALWLSLYGFRELPGGRMDGAYHRSCILSELHEFDRIFVARPLAAGWHGKQPANWFEVQDWQCEMWFSVGYKAEVDAMKRINDLIDAGTLTDPNYKKVEIVEIEPETPAGYFNFFLERGSVYDRALALSEEIFESLGLPKPSPQPRA
jgi:hypothetical protein